MQKQTFYLAQSEDFIQLNNLLKLLNIAQTGGHAKIIIDEGEVSVNGEVEYRRRKKLKQGDLVELDDIQITISKK